MEREGVSIDADGIKAFGKEVSAKAEKISREIYEYAGYEFNIGSPKQLGSVLFEKLALPSAKKTKTGYSTNADVLESLMDKHPIVPLITEYRALTKLQNTYVTGLLKVVGEDGRIHSTFKQTETRTGRISSAEPNIQNIPVRTPLGREMRRFFTAKDGCLLVDADYSQIELRVLAHISGDVIMKKAFLDGVDIHTVTASQVFNQPIEWVTPDLRSKAKAVNFGIVYGIGAFSLSKDIGVSVPKASEYIRSYLSKYSGIAHYMEQTVAKAQAEAEAYRLKSEQITPQMIAMEYIDKWDGKLPAVAGGDSSSMLIDISQIIAQMEETAGNGNTSQPAAQPPVQSVQDGQDTFADEEAAE